MSLQDLARELIQDRRTSLNLITTKEKQRLRQAWILEKVSEFDSLQLFEYIDYKELRESLADLCVDGDVFQFAELIRIATAKAYDDEIAEYLETQERLHDQFSRYEEADNSIENAMAKTVEDITPPAFRYGCTSKRQELEFFAEHKGRE